jgi:hypothetical protein
MSNNFEKLSQQLQNQNLVIQNLEEKNASLQSDVKKLQKTNYDPVFEFLSKQLQAYSENLNEKLNNKADKLVTDSVIPKKLEDLYVHFQERMQDLKSEVLERSSLMNKENMKELLANKVKKKNLKLISFVFYSVVF